MSRIHAHRMIEAAYVTNNLLPIGNILPRTESQARPLASLEPAEQVEAWRLAVETLEGHRGGFSPKAAGKRANDIELYEVYQTSAKYLTFYRRRCNMIFMNTGKVKELTSLTDDQINYLIKKVDALKREKNQGKARDYSFRDLVYLDLAAVMRHDGYRLDEINQAINLLEKNWINQESPEEAGTLIAVQNKTQTLWMHSSINPLKNIAIPELDQNYRKRIPKVLYDVSSLALLLFMRNQLAFEFADAEKEAMKGN